MLAAAIQTYCVAYLNKIPEVYDGIVEIVSIAREAGDRSKVAVRSNDPNIDAVGTCVGPKGQRVQAIVNELKAKTWISSNGMKIQLYSSQMH